MEKELNVIPTAQEIAQAESSKIIRSYFVSNDINWESLKGQELWLAGYHSKDYDVSPVNVVVPEYATKDAQEMGDPFKISAHFRNHMFSDSGPVSFLKSEDKMLFFFKEEEEAEFFRNIQKRLEVAQNNGSIEGLLKEANVILENM